MAEQVDIYADLNTEEDGDALQNEADALYDDVLTGSVDTKTSLENPSSEGEATPVKILRSGRNVSGPYSVYVGHFSWWTSDRDLIAMAKTLGVKDVLEVKFAEFKANGQSRGFAKMVVSTEDSLKRLLHSMSQCEIDGEKLECRIASRSHLEMFENQANKRYPQRSDSKAEPERDEGRSSVPKKPEITLPLPLPYPPVKPPPVMPAFFGARPPLFNTPPPMFPHPPPHAPFNPLNPHLPKPYLPNTHLPNTHLPNTHTHIPNMHTHPHPPSLHINPAFFSSAHATHSSSSTYGQQRDVDSEELINRNRLVASNAINKAMSGATSETIETLLTAIAVIRQSRVYTDERCQTLVESLKDCLYSVESKSCSSRRRHRSRDRARSREKERYRDRSSSTDRERERERERERGRDRDHRDRY